MSIDARILFRDLHRPTLLGDGMPGPYIDVRLQDDDMDIFVFWSLPLINAAHCSGRLYRRDET
jgi:hypothetical protein